VTTTRPDAVAAPVTGAAWRVPLFRSGHLLVLNSALTAGMGFVFWLIAARMYPAAVVGSNAAAVSAMMFLAGLAQLNLMSALLRFVPQAGIRTARMVARAYAIGATLSAASAVVFVAGLRVWAPDLASILHGPTAFGFVAATALWSIFVMQDNVLVGVQRPGLVAVENLVFAALKVALLIPGAVLIATVGIWYSWSLAAAVAVMGTTWYLFRRAIPRFAALAPSGPQAPSLRVIATYLVPDFLGSLAWIAATALVPVLVLDLTDPRHAGAFSMAWSVGFTLFTVPAAFGQSLVAHGAADATDADSDHRRVRNHVLCLLVPVVAALVLVAPVVLGFFGRWYADAGTSALRLVALAAVPNVVVALAVSHARVTRQMRTVVVVLTSVCVLVLVLTVVLVPRIGIAGAGWAWVVGETVVAAAILLAPLVRRARSVRSATGGVPEATVRRTAAELARIGYPVHGRCATVSDTAVLFARTGGRPAVVKLAESVKGTVLLDRETGVLARLHAEEGLGTWRTLLPERIAHGTAAGVAYAVDLRLPGRVTSTRRTPSAQAAGAALAPLHELTAHFVPMSTELLHAMVLVPVESLRTMLTGREIACGQLDRLADELGTAVAGRSLRLGWTHGDFHPGNVLVSATGRISGLVDWSQARDADLAELDLALWLLTSASLRRYGSFGRQVADRLSATSPWTRSELNLLDRGVGRQLPPRAVLLLAWLRHVTENLAKSERYAASPLWTRRAVLPVLRELAR
jgi:O-antigen/teichoic acid export membrane protein/Ser/Thr protein kinase RdoA (MazF antagonist)